MNDAKGSRAVEGKPKRQNFKTDDEFGEAYAQWMAAQVRTSAAAPAPASAPNASATTVLPRRSEAERDAWNVSTKARFLRAKNVAPD